MRWFKQLFSRRRRYHELHESIQEHLKKRLRTWSKMVCRGKTPSKPRAVSLET